MTANLDDSALSTAEIGPHRSEATKAKVSSQGPRPGPQKVGRLHQDEETS